MAPPDAVSTGKRLVVLIPAHNEERSVGEVVREVRRTSDCEVVVIDDGSSDNTVVLARAAGASVIRLRVRLGAWGATQAGIRYAIRNGYQYAITMDADGQHLAGEIDRMLQPVYSGKAHVVIGACPHRASRLRRIAWSFFRMLTGFSIEDLTSGFRALDHEAMQVLASRHATLLDHQDIGVLLLLQLHGMKIEEVAVHMKARHDGCSRVYYSWPAVASYMLQTGLLCVARRNIRVSTNSH
jgi:glycosyltransferase involved in cell wall biosynthesis